MERETEHTETYVNSIFQDIRNHFVKEEVLEYSEEKIGRLYTFEDGAVVKYEWQNAPRFDSGGVYNHKFTLVNVPKPNPNKLKEGVIKVINYPV